MKKTLAIACSLFFVMSILAKDVTAMAWEIWYYSNKAFVAKELCENKKKPEMHCDGKCYLAKQLKKVEQPAPAEKQAPVNGMKLKPVDWISVSTDRLNLPGSAIPVSKHVLRWPETTPALLTFNSSIFHPPTA